MKLKAKPGGILSDKDIQKMDRFILEKYPDGIFTAKDILEIARPTASPLHDYFNWNDSEAAEKYRLDQASHLIRCIVVEIDGENHRKYVGSVYLEDQDRSVYMETSKARQNEDIWDGVLARALNDAMAWKNRYEKLKELTLITQAIEKTAKKLKAKK